MRVLVAVISHVDTRRFLHDAVSSIAIHYVKSCSRNSRRDFIDRGTLRYFQAYLILCVVRCFDKSAYRVVAYGRCYVLASLRLDYFVGSLLRWNFKIGLVSFVATRCRTPQVSSFDVIYLDLIVLGATPFDVTENYYSVTIQPVQIYNFKLRETTDCNYLSQ